MERKYENNLENGLAYLEFRALYTKDKHTGETLKSKNGNLMLNVQWSAVDSKGNCGSVYDYIVITDKAKFKIDNLENAIGLNGANGLFDHEQERFNLGAFTPWTKCGAVIERDERGPKIKRYVPLEFYKTVEKSINDGSDKEPSNDDNKTPVTSVSAKEPKSTDIDFGDLPF